MGNISINKRFVTPSLRNNRVYQGSASGSVFISGSSSSGDSSSKTLQQVLMAGNETTQSIVLQTADKSKSYTIAIDTNGNLVLTGSTANTTVISNGDIQAYAGSNPAINWWDGLAAIVDGSTVTYSGGQLHAAAGSTYSLPIASSSVLGGVKQGTNITIDANGVISASAAAQVQSDWNVTTGLGKILNKPTTLSGYGITDAQPFSTAWNTGNFTPSNYLPLIGGTLTGSIGLPSVAGTTWAVGTGDGANYTTYNTKLSGWNGLAFANPTAGGTYPNQVSGVLDFRQGTLDMKGGFNTTGAVTTGTVTASNGISNTSNNITQANNWGIGWKNTSGVWDANFYYNAANVLKLWINGGDKYSFDGSGNFTASGTITAYGGNFNAIMGAKTTWGGTSYPTVYGTSSESWVMIHMPHIPFLQNGVNGYSGIGYGSSITFGTDAAATHHYRVGSFTNAGETSVDAFRIIRDSTSKLLELSSSGALSVLGTGACYAMADRTSQNLWIAYADNNIYRIYVNGADKLIVDSNGNQSITGIYNSNNSSSGICLRIGSQNDASTAPTNTAQVIATNGNLHLDAASTHNIYLGYYNNLVTYVGTGGLSVSGNVTATGDVSAFSDRRLKTNLQPIKSVLSNISKMSGYRFNRVDTEDKTRVHIGLIAQEIEKHYPELVHDDGVTKSVNYMGFTAVLLQAVKELKTKVSELERRVN